MPLSIELAFKLIEIKSLLDLVRKVYKFVWIENCVVMCHSDTKTRPSMKIKLISKQQTQINFPSVWSKEINLVLL